MMNAAFAELGMDWRYVHLPISPQRFVETARALPASGYRGANVTIPHKLAARELVDELTAAAEAIGAVNTLSFEGGRILGENTDAGGLIDALGTEAAGKRALVLGAGGAGRAAVYALQRAGADVLVWNRTAKRAEALVADLGGRVVDRAEPAEIVVNATSVGLRDPDATFKALPLQADSLGAGSCVVDMVYREGGTRLLEAARTRGADVVDGLEILIAQGAASFERWTGRAAPRQAMRAAARVNAK